MTHPVGYSFRGQRQVLASRGLLSGHAKEVQLARDIDLTKKSISKEDIVYLAARDQLPESLKGRIDDEQLQQVLRGELDASELEVRSARDDDEPRKREGRRAKQDDRGSDDAEPSDTTGDEFDTAKASADDSPGGNEE
jgi:hypothetical protein